MVGLDTRLFSDLNIVRQTFNRFLPQGNDACFPPLSGEGDGGQALEMQIGNGEVG